MTRNAAGAQPLTITQLWRANRAALSCAPAKSMLSKELIGVMRQSALATQMHRDKRGPGLEASGALALTLADGLAPSFDLPDTVWRRK